MKVPVTEIPGVMSALLSICMARDILTFRALETHSAEDD